MVQLKVGTGTGKIFHKNIMPTRFAVTFECSCGGLVEFRLEENKRCRGCDTLYQLRVMVGKVKKV